MWKRTVTEYQKNFIDSEHKRERQQRPYLSEDGCAHRYGLYPVSVRGKLGIQMDDCDRRSGA